MVWGELFLMVTPPPGVDAVGAGVLLEDETADGVLVGTASVDEEVETGDGVGVGVELEVDESLVAARVEMDAAC